METINTAQESVIRLLNLLLHLLPYPLFTPICWESGGLGDECIYCYSTTQDYDVMTRIFSLSFLG